MGRVEHPAGGRAQAFVIVGDHQRHASQASVGETAQELGPEGLRLGRSGGDAEHLALAVLVHCDSDYHRTADDAPALADLEVGRIEPEVGPGSLQRPGEERVHALVDLGAERLAWDFDMPPAPMAFTRSSTERVETPWT